MNNSKVHALNKLVAIALLDLLRIIPLAYKLKPREDNTEACALMMN